MDISILSVSSKPQTTRQIKEGKKTNGTRSIFTTIRKEEMLKKCPKCGRVLPENMFAPNTRHCKICRRDYDWQYRYGLSPEQYYELYKAQGGKCKICGKELPDGEYLHVDHKKKTGDVRGLLCDQCNRGIGFFHEDIEVMKKAIKYLEENQ